MTTPTGQAGVPDQERARTGVAVLRIVAALFMVVHGIARVWLGIVDDFGLFLADVGLPLGIAVAWGLTVFEIVGGSVLAFGRLPRPLAVLFALELAGGIALVHAPAGWFVVGAGRNGMEYSVLLIVVFAVVAWTATDPLDEGGADTGA